MSTDRTNIYIRPEVFQAAAQIRAEQQGQTTPIEEACSQAEPRATVDPSIASPTEHKAPRVQRG